MRRNGAKVKGLASAKYNPRITLNLSQYLFDNLTRIAETSDITRTALLRVIVQRYINQNRWRPVKVKVHDLEE